MKKRIVQVVCCMLSLGIVFVSACGSSESKNSNTQNTESEVNGETAQSSGNGDVYSLVSASLGGTYYIIASGLSEVINQNVDGITVNNVISAGSTANAIKVGTGESELGMTNYYSGMRAVNGETPYEDSYEIMGICALQESALQFNSLTSSGIKTMEDLKGKSVSIGPAGGGGALLFEEIIPYWGLSMNDMNLSYLSYSDGGEALTDGRIDVNVPHGAPPLEAISTASVTDDISLISMEEDILAQVIEDYPYYDVVTIPAGTYEGIDEDITTIGVQDILVCRADMDEETVYQITKAIYENLDYMHKIHSSIAELEFEGYKDSLVPLHPGAKRFYEEMGIGLE